jgi:hypothetical protein
VSRRLASFFVVAFLAGGVAGADASSGAPGFRSPTGNIRCELGDPSHLFCSIGVAAYAPRMQALCIAPPTSLDWHGFELDAAKRATRVCSGGMLVRPIRLPALRYGASWHRGPFTCVSRITGVTCRTRAGHGLFLSRESWRGW